MLSDVHNNDDDDLSNDYVTSLVPDAETIDYLPHLQAGGHSGKPR